MTVSLNSLAGGGSHAKMKTGMGQEVTLPDELVEKILGLVPFPFLFKMRVLSKSWKARLSSISSQDDEETKCQIRSFQEQVGEMSPTEWKTYCPILLRRKNIVAYDQASHQWRSILSLSFLPDNLCLKKLGWRREGALVLISDLLGDFYVANILTRSWKQLPLPPVYDDEPRLVLKTFFENMWLIHTSSQTYKVVVFRRETGNRCFFAEVYDSTLGAWGRKVHRIVSVEMERFGSRSTRAFHNGNFYKLVSTDGINTTLMTFNLEEQNFTLLKIPPLLTSFNIHERLSCLVSCRSSLVLVEFDHRGDQVAVCKFDLGLRSWSEVTRGPPAALNFGTFAWHPSCDGDSLFFLGEQNDRGILAYNVHENEWSSLPLPPGVLKHNFFPNIRPCAQGLEDILIIDDWRPNNGEGVYEWDGQSSFRPGLNPFSAV